MNYVDYLNFKNNWCRGIALSPYWCKCLYLWNQDISATCGLIVVKAFRNILIFNETPNCVMTWFETFLQLIEVLEHLCSWWKYWNISAADWSIETSLQLMEVLKHLCSWLKYWNIYTADWSIETSMKLIEFIEF